MSNVRYTFEEVWDILIQAEKTTNFVNDGHWYMGVYIDEDYRSYYYEYICCESGDPCGDYCSGEDPEEVKDNANQFIEDGWVKTK